MNPSQEPNTRLPTRRGLTLLSVLSFVIAILMAAASVIGILYRAAVYPTDDLLQSFVPTDVVNLLIGLPILLGSMWLARRGKLIGLLLWPGALFFVLYTYFVYVLAVPLNAAFLLHLTLLTLSVYTIIGLIASIDGEAVQQRLAGSVPERVAGGILAGLGLLFFLRAIGIIVSALISQTPIAETELAINVTDALIAPALVIGGVLLWRRKEFGYVTGLGLLFQASMLFIGLIVFLLVQPFVTAATFSLVDVAVIFVLGLISVIPFALFARRGVRSQNAVHVARRVERSWESIDLDHRDHVCVHRGRKLYRANAESCTVEAAPFRVRSNCIHHQSDACKQGRTDASNFSRYRLHPVTPSTRQ